jgi:hypothetical protein
MHARWTELTKLDANTEDPVDRADQMMKEREFPETWCSPPGDGEDPESWWRRLAAQIQLPDAAA